MDERRDSTCETDVSRTVWKGVGRVCVSGFSSVVDAREERVLVVVVANLEVDMKAFVRVIRNADDSLDSFILFRGCDTERGNGINQYLFMNTMIKVLI